MTDREHQLTQDLIAEITSDPQRTAAEKNAAISRLLGSNAPADPRLGPPQSLAEANARRYDPPPHGISLQDWRASVGAVGIDRDTTPLTEEERALLAEEDASSPYFDALSEANRQKYDPKTFAADQRQRVDALKQQQQVE